MGTTGPISIVDLTDPDEKSACARSILERLPDWFGIPQAREEYIEKVRSLPFWAAVNPEGRRVGFFAAAIHYGRTGEIVVCGVLPEYRRQGVGKALWRAVEAYLRRNGCRYAMVETLSDVVPNEAYRQTRQFYRSVGFEPLVTLTEMWSESCPCLIMLKAL